MCSIAIPFSWGAANNARTWTLNEWSKKPECLPRSQIVCFVCKRLKCSLQLTLIWVKYSALSFLLSLSLPLSCLILLSASEKAMEQNKKKKATKPSLIQSNVSMKKCEQCCLAHLPLPHQSTCYSLKLKVVGQFMTLHIVCLFNPIFYIIALE